MKFRFVKNYQKTPITYLPKDVFEQKYKILMREILSDLGGVGEGKSFLHEWNYRNNFDDLFIKNLIVCDIEELSDEVAAWGMCGIRPEQIMLALIIHFNTYIDELNLHKYYKEEELHKLFNKINKEAIEFNQECAELYDCKFNDYSYITEQYDKYRPTGMGFNLITTSTSKALLFQAMNAHAIDKQIGENARAKRYAISQYADSKAESRYTKVSALYNEFIKYTLNELDNSFKLLEKMKKKCTKEDLDNYEIKKSKRKEENLQKELKLNNELKEADKEFRNILSGKKTNPYEGNFPLWTYILPIVIILIIFAVTVISISTQMNENTINQNNTEEKEESKIAYPKLYLNSLETDINRIKNDKEAQKVTKELIETYNTSTFKDILTNEKTLDNYLYIGFISYLTNYLESTDLNKGSKEYLNYTHNPVTDYTVSKIYVNGFEDNKINNKNDISSILYELSDGTYLRCDFVRLDEGHGTIGDIYYEKYTVWYDYRQYDTYEEFTKAIEKTNYKLYDYKEIAVDEFNKVMNENKDFIKNYVDYKVNYYYPNLQK